MSPKYLTLFHPRKRFLCQKFHQLSSPLATSERKKTENIFFLDNSLKTPKQDSKKQKKLRIRKHIIFYLFSKEWRNEKGRQVSSSSFLLSEPRLGYCYYYFYYELRNNIKISYNFFLSIFPFFPRNSKLSHCRRKFFPYTFPLWPSKKWILTVPIVVEFLLLLQRPHHQP